MTTLFDKYRAKIAARDMSERDIISLCSAMNAGKFGSELIRSALREHKPPICAAQARKGIDWLRKQKRDQFDEYELLVFDNFMRFELVNLVSRTGWLPVYRVHAHTGAWFDYVGRSGPVEILGNNEVDRPIAAG